MRFQAVLCVTGAATCDEIIFGIYFISLLHDGRVFITLAQAGNIFPRIVF